MYTSNLTESPGYMIVNIPKYVLCQNVTNDRVENIEISFEDEYYRPIDFYGDVLSFALHLV